MEINVDEINVEEIMGRIRERVREKKERGLYTDDEVNKVSGMKLITYGAGPFSMREDFQAYLNVLNKKWDTKTPEPTTSHRPVAGPLIVFVKKTVLKICQPITNMLFARQALFNHSLTGLLNSMLPEINSSIINCKSLTREFARSKKEYSGLLNEFLDLCNSHSVLLEKMDKWHEDYTKNPKGLDRNTSMELRQEIRAHKQRLEKTMKTLKEK